MIDPLVMQVILAALIIIAILRILSVKVGAWWLRFSLIIVLIALLLKRVDTIGELVGNDIISEPVSNLITLMALAAVAFAFEAARIRSSYLRRAEKERRFDLSNKHGPTIEYLEKEIREKDQARVGYDWEFIPKPKNPELMVQRRTDTG